MGAETAGMFWGRAGCVDLAVVVVRGFGCCAVCAVAKSEIEKRNTESERRTRGIDAPV
jgi:hypothetical protein